MYRFFSLFLLPVISLSALAKAPEFSIVCESPTHHKLGNPDVLDQAQETLLMKRVVEEAFPLLPAELKKVSTQIAFVVQHSDEGLTKRFLGWSAEDDKEYRYPDTKYFHPTLSPEGTIKVNFTEKFVKGMALGYQLGETDPKALAGVRAVGKLLVIHELTHAVQYHTKPVRDINANPALVVDGIVDADLLAEQKQKVEYELDAVKAHRDSTKPPLLLQLADAIDAYRLAHPAEFEEAGRFRLLSDTRPNPFVKRYLREEAQSMPLGREFVGTAKQIYFSQTVPAELTVKLKKINDAIAEAKEADRGALTKKSIPELVAIQREWATYMEVELTETLKKTWPFLKPIEERFQREKDRFRDFIEAL